MIVDLISDTVTRPSQGMMDAMMNAKVGDDVFKSDPTVNSLQEKAARMFGMEDALFFPSGTMANQAAIKVHTQPGDKIFCDKWSHVYNYEGGGAAFNSGVTCKLIDCNRGMFSANQLKSAVAGARLFNALVARNETPMQYGEIFDTISICLSKGLGAPVGSILLGSKQHIAKALRVRKLFGGGMRQAGFLASAGIYALENHIDRLKEDHQKAKQIEAVLQSLSYVKKVEPVETNIVIFYVNDHLDANDFIGAMATKNILLTPMGEGKIRIVTHLDITREMIDRLLEELVLFSDV